MEFDRIAYNMASWWRFGRRVSIAALTNASGDLDDLSVLKPDPLHPMVWQASFFLRDHNLDCWLRKESLNFPTLRYICGTSADAVTDIPRTAFARSSVSLREVPSCPNCSATSPKKMIVLSHRLSRNDYTTSINITCPSRRFLRATVICNLLGDVLPPWLAYPGESPYSPIFGQGNSEYWYANLWLPFMRELPRERQHHYFDRWNAPVEWQEEFATDQAR